ncbi:MAG: hypothetical protein IJ476_03980 [Bacteroidales bacterium]|nr:hypothetical protein [Bacteroidales bacterium]
MAIFVNGKDHKWEFENVGGTSRVRIRNGADIAHLKYLDPKLWTVLSCPVKGLEIDEKSLSYIDADGDGKIRVNDVVKTATWVTDAVNNDDMVLNEEDFIYIRHFDTSNEVGLRLYNTSRQILDNLGKREPSLSIEEVTDMATIFANTRFNGDGVVTVETAEEPEDKAAIVAAVTALGGVKDRCGELGVNNEMIEKFYNCLNAYDAWQKATVEAPFGADTDAVIAAYQALDAKVRDYFMRSKLAAFSPASTEKLDVQTSQIEAISAGNLAEKQDEIAQYPIARVTGKPEINLSEPVNPVWAAQFNTVVKVALPNNTVLTEEDWNAVGAKFAPYLAWKQSKAGTEVECLGYDTIKELIAQDRKEELFFLVEQDCALEEEANDIEMLVKFLYIYRDFYRLLRNFITFEDFYKKDKTIAAIFQNGRLIVDQRECRFCMNVQDMAKHNASAATSGMYLLYCDCTSKISAAKMQIVAAVTVGEIGNLIVGKNAVYYDNKGGEWDAVITKIVDNPISVRQAFWSPYRRMATTIENLINKSAADKDAKMMANATAKINAAPASLPAAPAAGTPADGAKPAAQPPFDIAKFAGIFAAIGMALGMIGSALAALAKGIFALSWWQLLLSFVAILLLISGPAMVMAWMKLRRRNIAPILNANGWAINAAAKISIPFGETLTDMAKFPALKLPDPYKKKGMSRWSKFFLWLLVVAILAGVVIGLIIFDVI